MDIVMTFLYVFTLLILRINGVEENNWKLSREDLIGIEKQIQLQRNHTVKTICTRHGDLYDCVNFYKQSAFNHPLSTNLTFVSQKTQTLSPGKARNQDFSVISPKLGLKTGGCPDGTIPIKRVTKEDLIRIRLAQVNDDKPDGTINAICWAQESTGYTGLSATIIAYNPKVRSDQYSAAAVKLHFGRESIEAGWRVDPTLYGDNKTRLYIHTNTQNAHCFNTLCPGFVHTDKEALLDYVFPDVSTPGGKRYAVDIFITFDHNFNKWILGYWKDTEAGYWPGYLFEHPGTADTVEWGGEVFAHPGWTRPGMGSGLPLTGDTDYDAYFSQIKVKNGPISGGPSVDPINVGCHEQYKNYEVLTEGNVGGGLQYLTYFGGKATG